MLGLWPEGDPSSSSHIPFHNSFLPPDKLQGDSILIPPTTNQEIPVGEQQTRRKKRISESDSENQKEVNDNDQGGGGDCGSQ